jgi:hypothetical protein
MLPTAGESRIEEGRMAGPLGALIFLGSVLLVGIPLGWLWMLSQMGQPYLTVYLLALIGCPGTMIGWGMVLVRLNRLYLRANPDRTDSVALLEASVVFAVVIGVLILAAWLLLFPHGGGPVEGPWPG